MARKFWLIRAGVIWPCLLVWKQSICKSPKLALLELPWLESSLQRSTIRYFWRRSTLNFSMHLKFSFSDSKGSNKWSWLENSSILMLPFSIFSLLSTLKSVKNLPIRGENASLTNFLKWLTWHSLVSQSPIRTIYANGQIREMFHKA